MESADLVIGVLEFKKHPRPMGIGICTIHIIVIPAWTAGIQASMDGFKFAIHGTGYQLPGEYDELADNLE